MRCLYVLGMILAALLTSCAGDELVIKTVYIEPAKGWNASFRRIYTNNCAEESISRYRTCKCVVQAVSYVYPLPYYRANGIAVAAELRGSGIVDLCLKKPTVFMDKIDGHTLANKLMHQYRMGDDSYEY